MTASRDPDRLIQAFFDEGLDELPDPVYDAVRDRIEQTRQQTVIGRWKTSFVNKNMMYGLAAAAVVVVAIVGYRLLGDSSLGGPSPTTTQQPTATPSNPADGSLPVGSPFAWLDDSGGAVPVRVTIPASGWYGDPGFFALEKNKDSEPPDAVGVLVFNERSAWSVPGDACNWESSLPDTPSATIEEFVAALSAQASRDASAPVDIEVDGHAGKSITLHMPSDLAHTTAGVFPDCDYRSFCQFVDPEAGGAPVDTCARTAQTPGQVDELWIVKVNDALVVIDAAYYEGTPDELVEEQRAIVDSITFE
jgi:hypothetical protein